MRYTIKKLPKLRTFLVSNFFPNTLLIKRDLKLLKSIFAKVFIFMFFLGIILKLLIGLMRMIYRWKDIQIAQLILSWTFSQILYYFQLILDTLKTGMVGWGWVAW
jgi:hypothetical protein